MSWFITALLICVAFFSAAYIGSELLLRRLGRARMHRRYFGGEEKREESLYDEIALWEAKQEQRKTIAQITDSPP